MTSIHIVGKTPSSMAAALLLAAEGFSVHLLRSGNWRTDTLAPPKGHDHMLLNNRGLKVLQSMNLLKEVEALCIPVQRRIMHLKDGTALSLPYHFLPAERLLCVSESALGRCLYGTMRARAIQLYENTNVTGLDCSRGELLLKCEETGRKNCMFPDMIMADVPSDHTLVRHINPELENYGWQANGYGVKRLDIPRHWQGGLELARDAVHIWPRKEAVLVALPRLEEGFEALLFLPTRQGKYSFRRIRKAHQVRLMMGALFSDVLPFMDAPEEEFFKRPVQSVGWRELPHWFKTDMPCQLFGDSLAEDVPYFGQGLNRQLEDAFIFSQLSKTHAEHKETNWLNVFSQFYLRRRHLMKRMILQAYSDLQNLADGKYDDISRRKMAQAHDMIQKFYPESYKPRQSLLQGGASFSDVETRGAPQHQLLSELCNGDITEQRVDKLVGSYLK